MDNGAVIREIGRRGAEIGWRWGKETKGSVIVKTHRKHISH